MSDRRVIVRAVYSTPDTRRAHADGRAEQYAEMMQALAAMEKKYGGVRGQLLKKVREELTRLKPAGASERPTSMPTSIAGPRCSACGREMKMNGTDGRLMCMNGHFG
jgi:hypothetical protein